MNVYQSIENTDTGCHVVLDRVQLQRDYIDRMIDGMDLDTLCRAYNRLQPEIGRAHV